jgi:SAM-dependent methyltransferase
MTTSDTINRYATDWNTYSEQWQSQYGDRYRHLGDEWCDEGDGERRREQWVWSAQAEPWLKPNAHVLEIGPGGGKWTVRLATRVRQVTAFDVADAMLTRTRQRCEDARLENVAFALGDGSGLTGIANDSIDLVFSYDVFVHIALEDTVQYVSEFARVLKPGGMAVIHHAVNDLGPAWDRIESHNDWYRSGATLGQFYYHSAAALRRMYERAGLQVLQTSSYYCTMIFTVLKPAHSLTPRFEVAMRKAATAKDDSALQAAIADIQSVVTTAQSQLNVLMDQLAKTRHGQERYGVLQQLRRVFRG